MPEDHRADLYVYVDGHRVMRIEPSGAVWVAGTFYEAAEAFWDALASVAESHGIELKRTEDIDAS